MKKVLTMALIGIISLTFMTGCKPKTQEQKITVSEWDFITISYSSTNLSWETIEDNTELSYIVWNGSAIKALNTEVIGMELWEKKIVEVDAENGYGAFHNSTKIQDISNTIFETIWVTPVVWEEFQLWKDLKWTILAVSPVTTTIDFNEKYTLEPAIFNIEIVNIQKDKEE